MDELIKAQQALVKLSSFAENNQGVNLPNTAKEYADLAEAVMEVIRKGLTK
jgi:hypothetical protein